MIVVSFGLIDLNDDGKITRKELDINQRAHNDTMTTAELRKMIGNIDYDGNGVVEFTEYSKG